MEIRFLGGGGDTLDPAEVWTQTLIFARLASVYIIPALRNDVMLSIMWPNDDIVLKCCHHSSYHILPWTAIHTVSV